MIIIIRPKERVRAIGGQHIIEYGSIPHSLVRNLWYPNWVRRRTGSGLAESAFRCAVHVRLVVRAVEVLAVPAGGEVVNGHDSGWTGLLGEVGRLEPAGEDSLQTGVAETRVSLCAV